MNELSTPRHWEENPGLEEPRSAAWLGRFVPLAGAGFVALTIAAFLVVGPNPDSDASTSTLSHYYAAHHGHILAAGTLLGYSTMLFALFGVAVWSRLRRTALHPIVAGAALVGTAIATASGLANANAWHVLGEIGNKQTTSPGALQVLHISVSSGDVWSSAGTAILLLAVALAGIRARAFPRWLAWSALVLGIVQLAPAPAPIGFFSLFAFLLWTFVASIVMFRQSADTAQATAQRGSTAPLADPALTRS